ncbi:MAG TPA: 16S rRNA (uracil(1498)-N(3))-methyltransferase [Xanthobacteraceae bacterium]|nr:16S rRNA (uracil(1498)-N(3))-methyltransferase [Xanthobacteraceae bacterium]
MPRADFRTPRLFIDAPLAAGAALTLPREAANYLVNVLRLAPGAAVLVFNGRDGEWRASLAEAGKRAATLTLDAQTRPQPAPADLHYLFAPLKHARLDYMVQKAVEMGVSRLQPVMTHHTQATRINLDRMQANAIEAAEQCGILAIAETMPPLSFARMLAERDAARLLIFCDEDADIADPHAALRAALRPDQAAPPLAVLIGPEGGFSPDERAALLKQPHIVRLALGPRILRADTAAVAALAVVQTALGDWHGR